jgi:Protein of unknown function (DUF4232)
MRWIVRDLAVLAVGVVLTGAVLVALPAESAPGAAAAAECTNDHLKASYRRTEGATGHTYGRIRLRNVSDEACWIRGYGGLSYVGHGDGTQVGAPAVRQQSKKPRTVLQPGERVRSVISETTAGVFDEDTCRPTPVDGFRVYLPDETRSQFVRHRTTGCANAEVHLLFHKAYRRP